MNIIIIYGSTEGQTRKIAEWAVTQLSDMGHQARAIDSRRRMVDLDLGAHDAVILAGSVHERLHQETLTNFVIAHREQLREKPTLLISVSLSVAFSDGEDEARRYVDEFVRYTGFSPNRVSLVAGALRFAEYDHFMNQIVEHIVLAEREQIREDREFTDWAVLGADIEAFVKSV